LDIHLVSTSLAKSDIAIAIKINILLLIAAIESFKSNNKKCDYSIIMRPSLNFTNHYVTVILCRTPTIAKPSPCSFSFYLDHLSRYSWLFYYLSSLPVCYYLRLSNPFTHYFLKLFCCERFSSSNSFLNDNKSSTKKWWVRTFESNRFIFFDILIEFTQLVEWKITGSLWKKLW